MAGDLRHRTLTPERRAFSSHLQIQLSESLKWYLLLKYDYAQPSGLIQYAPPYAFIFSLVQCH